MLEINCYWCGSSNYRKVGIRKLVGRLKQIYYCKTCKSKFTGAIISDSPEHVVQSQRKTYSQNWPAYNSAQCQEKLMFLQILDEIVSKFQTERKQNGRPRKDISDILFACCLKVYTGFSGRRLNSELEIAQAQGYLKEVPHFNTVLGSFSRKDLTSPFHQILRFASLPIREAESQFAIDSTGFSTSMFSRWVDKRFGKDKTERIWVKAHAMCGTKTNIISSIEITEGHAGDSPYFVPLVNATAEDFKIKEVSADKAYSSRENLEAVVKVGAIPYIPFKNNATGKPQSSKVWSGMYRFYCAHQQEFYERYHRRSNIESTFSMIKRKFGNNLRTRTFQGHINEILCKAICHNIVVLIHEINEMGVNPSFFWGANETLRHW